MLSRPQRHLFIASSTWQQLCFYLFPHLDFCLVDMMRLFSLLSLELRSIPSCVFSQVPWGCMCQGVQTSSSGHHHILVRCCLPTLGCGRHPVEICKGRTHRGMHNCSKHFRALPGLPASIQVFDIERLLWSSSDKLSRRTGQLWRK